MMMMMSIASPGAYNPYAAANQQLEKSFEKDKEAKRNKEAGGTDSRDGKGKTGEGSELKAGINEVRAWNQELGQESTDITTQSVERNQKQTEKTSETRNAFNQEVQAMQTNGQVQVTMQNGGQENKGIQLDFGLNDQNNPEGMELKQHMSEALGPMAMEIMGNGASTADQLKGLAQGVMLQQNNDLTAIDSQLGQYTQITKNETEAAKTETGESNDLLGKGMDLIQSAMEIIPQMSALFSKGTALTANPTTAAAGAAMLSQAVSLLGKITSLFGEGKTKKNEGNEKSKKAQEHNKVAMELQKTKVAELIKLKEDVILANTKILKATIELFKEVMDTTNKNKDQLKDKMKAFKQAFKESAELMKGKRDSKSGQLLFNGQPLPGSGKNGTPNAAVNYQANLGQLGGGAPPISTPKLPAMPSGGLTLKA